MLLHGPMADAMLVG